jgi:hypothetical protein
LESMVNAHNLFPQQYPHDLIYILFPMWHWTPSTPRTSLTFTLSSSHRAWHLMRKQ